jgi:hypothetical protein
MAPRGGYKKSSNDEWMRVERRVYGEALRSADDMGQDLDIWLTDAIRHHAYRCELIQLKEQYRHDCHQAGINRQPSPVEADYVPKGPPPHITRPTGQGGGAPNGRNYRP